MKVGFIVLSLGLAASVSLGGCAHPVSASKSAAPSSSTESSSVDSGSSVSASDTPMGPDGQTEATSGEQAGEDALDVSDKLPYKGMPAAYIDQTWLGPADEVGERISGGKLDGAVAYYWRARNGTGDLVFIAHVNNDEVVDVSKMNTGKNYWGDGSRRFGSVLPDLEASGESVDKKSSQPSEKPDPDGWDDAEDYADANYGSFRSWDEAYDYWLEEMTEASGT